MRDDKSLVTITATRDIFLPAWKSSVAIKLFVVKVRRAALGHRKEIHLDFDRRAFFESPLMLISSLFFSPTSHSLSPEKVLRLLGGLFLDVFVSVVFSTFLLSGVSLGKERKYAAYLPRQTETSHITLRLRLGYFSGFNLLFICSLQ